MLVAEAVQVQLVLLVPILGGYWHMFQTGGGQNLLEIIHLYISLSGYSDNNTAPTGILSLRKWKSP